MAHHPYRVTRRSVPFIAVAFVSVMAASLLVSGWGSGDVSAADATPVRGPGATAATQLDMAEHFYDQKVAAPAGDLPAQF